MAQQLRLRAERLLAHRARQAGLPLAAALHVRLHVAGQAGQVGELLLALGTLVNGTGAVAVLVRPQLRSGFEDGVALEAGMDPGEAADWELSLRGVWLRKAGLLVTTTGLILQVHDFCRAQTRAAGLVGPEVTDHLDREGGASLLKLQTP